jgi:TonB family protein
VRPPLLAIVLIVSLALRSSLHAEANESAASTNNTGTNKKSVVHLVVGAASNLKQIFNYCPFPTLPNEYSTEYKPLAISGNGVYRLIVDQQGKVTEIKILKRMGALGDSRADVAALKTFIRWQAKPGPERIVDVTWGLPPSFRVITTKGRTGSHIPRR